MTTVVLELPEGVSSDDARFALAIGLWMEGRLSQGQAAALLHCSRQEFISLLVKRGLPFTNITPDDLREELENWPSQPSPTPPR
ncbi:MAG: UPF0175 family protein [Candidatus Sumerlaeia bacterium]|nr:UPF0175 family protein [Candidatus Sumerlaeia bacterium]